MLREPLKRTDLHYVFCGTPVEEHWSRTLILQNTALCSKHTFPNSKYRSTRYTFISLTLTPNLHPASHILITSSKMRLYDACCLQNRWICFGWEPNKQIKFLSYRRQRPSNAWWRFPTMEVSTLGSSRSWRTCGFQCWEVSTESRGTICLMFVAFQVFEIASVFLFGDADWSCNFENVAEEGVDPAPRSAHSVLTAPVTYR